MKHILITLALKFKTEKIYGVSSLYKIKNIALAIFRIRETAKIFTLQEYVTNAHECVSVVISGVWVLSRTFLSGWQMSHA